MHFLRRRLIQSAVALLLAVVGIGVRLALVRGLDGPPWLMAAGNPSEVLEAGELPSENTGRSRFSWERQKLTESRRTAESQVAKPKVIEIEYDEQGRMVVSSVDQAAGSDSSRDSNPSAAKGTEGLSPKRKEVQIAGSGWYRNDKWHFEIGIPPGWQEMSSTELQQINQGARTLGFGNQITYQVGFRRRNTRPGTCPYVLVSATAGKLKSYEEVELALDRELPGSVKRAEQALENVAGGLSVEDASLDSSTNRVAFRSQLDVPAVGTLQALSVGHIGSESIVFVHCYSLENQFHAWLSTFHRINDAFTFDEGYAFVEKESAGSRLDELVASIPGGSWTAAALAGAGTGMLGCLMVRLFRKSGRRRTSHRDNYEFGPLCDPAQVANHS